MHVNGNCSLQFDLDNYPVSHEVITFGFISLLFVLYLAAAAERQSIGSVTLQTRQAEDGTAAIVATWGNCPHTRSR